MTNEHKNNINKKLKTMQNQMETIMLYIKNELTNIFCCH